MFNILTVLFVALYLALNENYPLEEFTFHVNNTFAMAMQCTLLFTFVNRRTFTSKYLSYDASPIDDNYNAY